MKPAVLAILFTFCVKSLLAADLYWYLAASMTKPGKEVVKNYNQLGGDQVFLILGGSGQILNKIIASGKGDIYSPASSAFAKKAEKHNLVKRKRLLLKQIPVFGLSKAAGKNIRTFQQLTQSQLAIGVGNPKTMALGRTYQDIEKKMGSSLAGLLREKTLIRAVNISQIVNYLKTETIQAGTIFDSVAKANQISYVEIPVEYNVTVQAYFMTLKTSKFTDQVKAFETHLFHNAAVFRKYGFQLLQ